MGGWAGATSIVGVHYPGHSPAHRIPAGAKVAGLVVAIAVVLVVDTPWVAAALAGLGVLVLLSTRVPLVLLAGPLRMVAIMLLALAVAQGLLLGWPQAVLGTSRVLACLTLAWAVSLTTPLVAMLDLLARVLGPLRRLGVDAERVAMTIALAIRAVSLVVTAVARTDEARRARGARLSIRALAIPSVVRTMQIAEALGEALLARGYHTDHPVQAPRDS